MATANSLSKTDTSAGVEAASEVRPGAETEEISNWKPAVSNALTMLAYLPVNWDDYGAPPIDKKLIRTAREFIQVLPDVIAAPPQVTPISPGNLQLEWHRGRKVLEFEIESIETIRYLKWDPDHGVEDEDSMSIKDGQRAGALVAWFFGNEAMP